MKKLLMLLFVLVLHACAGPQVQECPEGIQTLSGCAPANAVDDEYINQLYTSRTWVPPDKLNFDPIKSGEDAQVPINKARAKIIGPTYVDALTSLAAKIWLIENAQYTVDVMYYIFKRDPVGYAVLGALCNAVKRGVDVRIMVDSIGSFHVSHDELRALETCDNEADFMRNAKGQVTTKKARVQVVIFNALTKFQFNRRSHDKVLVVDGHFPDKTAVMTGGRNVSLDYYGIKEDGSKDPTAFRDLEILLRAHKTDSKDNATVGKVSELYYTLLFLHKGNKRLYPIEEEYEYGETDLNEEVYVREREKGQNNLAFVKNLPEVAKHMQKMPRYMSEGFHSADVRIAHQLSNLTAKDVTTKVQENIEKNPNSIMYLINKVTEKRHKEGITSGTLRVVSPYLFTYLYRNEEGEIVYDEAKEILDLLRKHPNLKLEVITNSVMTSDNYFTQSMIDIDMFPRLLLTPELQQVWKAKTEKSEFNPRVVESEEWKRLINHPQVFLYQTGGIDSVMLGGKTYYGKLHAKFIVGGKVGFIGTSNFDYRSNLYNNEMGFFYRSPEVRQDLLEIFEMLKSTSYRWGTPEWLKMRKRLMESDTDKSGHARKQRGTYKFIRALGLEYLM